MDKFKEVNKGKILIIKGQSQYNVLRYASDLIAKGFEENGYQVVILDCLNQNVGPKEITEVMKDNGKFIFSFNALLHNNIINDSGSMYDQLGFPTLGFLVDHPLYHNNRLLISQNDNINISVIDYDHLEYIKYFYPKLKHVSFIPHFSFQYENYIQYEKRSIDVYYPGSYKNPDDFKENLSKIPDVFKKISIAVFQLILNNKDLTLISALKLYFTSINFEYSNEEFIDVINQISFVDLWIRNYRRDKIIKTILNAGINITVSGKGWEQLESLYKNKLQIIGSDGLDIKDNLSIIADSKILLNTFPEFKNGSHERVFTAMRNGCICLTDANGYTLKHFDNYENIVFYSLDNIDALPEIIQDLINNPTKAMYIAQNGYSKANIDYCEKNIAKRILTMMGLE